MHNVSYGGITTNVVKSSTEYRDTVMTPVITDEGPTELVRISDEFSRTYNPYNDSLSCDTASYVNSLGYNILAQRVIPWKKKLLGKWLLHSTKIKISKLVVDTCTLGDIKDAVKIIIAYFNYSYDELTSDSDLIDVKLVINDIISDKASDLGKLTDESTKEDVAIKVNSIIDRLSTESLENKFSIIFNNELDDCTYIKITKLDSVDQDTISNDNPLKYGILIWTNWENHVSIPGSFCKYNEVITKDKLKTLKKKKDDIVKENLENQVKLIGKALSKYKFNCIVDINKLEVTVPQDCVVEYGVMYQDIHYSGIRFFNRGAIFSEITGVVSEVTNDYIVITSQGSNNYISNPDTDEYAPAVKVGQYIVAGSLLYLDFNYSYPNNLKTYSDRTSIDNYKLESLAKSSRTYSINIRLDRFIESIVGKDKSRTPIDISENGYIIVNNGIYNILIWFAYFTVADDYGIVVDKSDGELNLARVYTLRKFNENSEYGYTIKIESKERFILSRQMGIDELDTELAICTDYNEDTKSGTFTSHYGNVDSRIGFSVNDKGLIDITSSTGYFTDILKGDIFEVLKYKYLVSEIDNFVYNGDLGDFIEPGDPLFGPKLPVIKSLDINPDYYYINIFKETIPTGTLDEKIIDMQITRLLSILNTIGFIVEYDDDKKVITLSSYDSLRIVDISDIFHTFDNINGSYDILCMIDDEYKALDIWSKIPTHNNELELEFKNNDISDYSLEVRKLDKYDEVIFKENFLVSLNPNSQYFIDDILSARSQLIKSTTYMVGYIKPGVYRLNRVEEYNPTYEDILCSIINSNMLSRRFEIFMDGGCLVPLVQDYVGNLLNTKNKLSLFTVVNPENFDYQTAIKYCNIAYSYPYIQIDDKTYPAYVAFLETAIKNNDYTGEVNVDQLVEYPTDYQVHSLMSIYFDNYRYVITHNYIKSEYGAILPEISLVNARIVNMLTYDVNYHAPSKFDVYRDLNSRLSYIYSISKQILSNIRIKSFRVEERNCYIDLITEYNLYKGDPVTINVQLNINI